MLCIYKSLFYSYFCLKFSVILHIVQKFFLVSCEILGLKEGASRNDVSWEFHIPCPSFLSFSDLRFDFVHVSYMFSHIVKLKNYEKFQIFQFFSCFSLANSRSCKIKLVITTTYLKRWQIRHPDAILMFLRRHHKRTHWPKKTPLPMVLMLL